MPFLSEFYGIKIHMYHKDHNPPHFHLHYDGKWYVLDFAGNVLEGDKLPSKANKLTKEWLLLHQEELYLNWDRAQNGEELIRIEPLR